MHDNHEARCVLGLAALHGCWVVVGSYDMCAHQYAPSLAHTQHTHTCSPFSLASSNRRSWQAMAAAVSCRGLKQGGNTSLPCWSLWQGYDKSEHPCWQC
jgi:hypothetical protein